MAEIDREGRLSLGTWGRPKIGGVRITPPNQDKPTLVAAGIDKHLAKRARKMAVKVQSHGGDRRSENQERGSALLKSASQAEQLTGITHQQVSKWRKRLEDRDAYRESLYGDNPKRIRAVRR